MSARPGFGSTLALKGAVEEQLQFGIHCEPGCVWCEINARPVLEQWLQQEYGFSHHFNPTPRIP